MRILLVGQAAFGAKVFEALREQQEHIAAVYTPAEKQGGRPDPLAAAAMAADVPVCQPESYHDQQTFIQYQSFAPDLTILAFVTDIIPAYYFDTATHGAICYHPSLLPRHRGASAINWALMMGDQRTGLTVFWPDGGIDTGPILLQKEIDIGPHDTTGTLYFDKLFPMGVEAIVESVALIKAGKAPRFAQEASGATYEPPCDDRVACLDWFKPAQEVYNLIRGCDPQPGAYSYLKGKKTRFYGTRLMVEKHDQMPGTLLGTDGQGLKVAVDRGVLLVGKLKTDGYGKMSGAEFASETGLQPGDQFQNPPTDDAAGSNR